MTKANKGGRLRECAARSRVGESANVVEAVHCVRLCVRVCGVRVCLKYGEKRVSRKCEYIFLFDSWNE